MREVGHQFDLVVEDCAMEQSVEIQPVEKVIHSQATTSNGKQVNSIIETLIDLKIYVGAGISSRYCHILTILLNHVATLTDIQV